MMIFTCTTLIILFADSAGITKPVWSEPPAAPAQIAQQAPHGSGSGHAGSMPDHDMGSHPHQGDEHKDHKTHAGPQTKLRPAEGAVVKILAPQAGQSFKGDQVPIHFDFIKGKRGNHIHAYVDGELMGMFSSEKGTLTGIQPGHHVLELRVVAEDHQTELDAVDCVEFMVK